MASHGLSLPISLGVSTHTKTFFLCSSMYPWRLGRSSANGMVAMITTTKHSVSCPMPATESTDICAGFCSSGNQTILQFHWVVSSKLGREQVFDFPKYAPTQMIRRHRVPSKMDRRSHGRIVATRFDDMLYARTCTFLE